MPSTYTTNLGFEKVATGEQTGTWGGTLNTNFDLIGEAISGLVTVTLTGTGSTGTPNTLTVTDGTSSDGRHAYVEFDDGGDLGDNAYVQYGPSDSQKIVYIRNSLSGGRSIYLFQGTYSSSRDYVVPNGVTALVKFDGLGAASSTAELVMPVIPMDSLTLPNAGLLSWNNAAGSDTIDMYVDASNDFLIKNGATTIIQYDLSGTSWNFQANDITTTGDITGGNLSGTNTGDEVAATSTTAGIIELATQAEVDAGTDTSRAVTPDTLANWSGGGGGGTSSPLTTKGDLWVYTTTDARLAVGADGQFLTADSTEASGVKWSTVAPGSGISNVVEDTTPELGGNLDSNNFDIYLTNTGTAKGIRFYEPSGGGTSYMLIRAGSMAANYTLTLPSTDGTSGDYLKTDGSGNLSWDEPAGGSGETPAITSNGSTPSLNTGITGAEIRSLIGAGTGDGDGDITGVTVTAGSGLTGGGTISTGSGTLTLNCDFGTLAGEVAEGNHTHTESDITNLGSYYESGDSPTFGTVTASSFNVSSGRHLKTQVFGSMNADGILELNPILYYLNDDEDQRIEYGYFADDVAVEYPEMVQYDEEGRASSVDYAKLTVPLAMKLREHEDRFAEIERRLEEAGIL
jgi:hypothetical protein